jgi:hypothetical protein
MKGFCRIISRSGREAGETDSMAEIRDRRLAEKLGWMGGYWGVASEAERSKPLGVRVCGSGGRGGGEHAGEGLPCP